MWLAASDHKPQANALSLAWPLAIGENGAMMNNANANNPMPANYYDVAIVGGGPAGASAAIHLANAGQRVLVLEKESFPRHKLCGEFISPECLGEFVRLGVLPEMMDSGGVDLRETVFYNSHGRGVGVPSAWFGAVHTDALGLSRARMDDVLLARARAVGAEVWETAQVVGALQDTPDAINGVRVRVKGAGTQEVRARVTLDASGRGRVLARRLAIADSGQKLAIRNPQSAIRNPQRAPLVAFKAHLAHTSGTPATCEIYFYRGGYGGLNGVEGGAGNLCFIVSADDAKRYNGDALQIMRSVVMTNPRAALTLRDAVPVTAWTAVALERFGRFAVAPCVGLLTAGDAAAFIDPFTGSGMLMALQCGALAAAAISQHLPHLATNESNAWARLARDYEARHNAQFAARLRVCSWLRRAAFTPGLADVALRVAGLSDALRRRLARATRHQ